MAAGSRVRARGPWSVGPCSGNPQDPAARWCRRNLQDLVRIADDDEFPVRRPERSLQRCRAAAVGIDRISAADWTKPTLRADECPLDGPAALAIELDHRDVGQMPGLTREDTVVEHAVAAIQDGISAFGAARNLGVRNSAQQEHAGGDEHPNDCHPHLHHIGLQHPFPRTGRAGGHCVNHVRRSSQSQLTVGKKTWLSELPKLPPILVPPPEAQIRPSTKADP